MTITPQMLELCGDAVIIRCPKGVVRLSFRADQLDAQYLYGQLMNGSAEAYAGHVKQAALEYAQSFILPWHSTQATGTRIHDHSLFYTQTFSSQLLPIETLKRWLCPR